MLDGAWVQKDETTVSWALETDVDGVHLRKGNKEYLYGYDDCVQFGTLAMALCHNGLPQWTVSLNKDCIMNNENQGHDFITEGTISLCKVSMAKTAPIILEGGIPEETYEIKPSPTGEEQGKLLVDEMKRMVNSLGEMETLEDSASYLKIVTDSTNPFDIGRMAAEQEDKVRSVNGIDVGVQITSMQLLAGDIYDFLLEVNVTENFSNPENSEEESEADLSRKYRIMKCDDGYLAAPVAIRVDGTYGLEAPAMEQKLETANDSAYYYFVAGQR